MNYGLSKANTGDDICNLFADYFQTTFLSSIPANFNNVIEDPIPNPNNNFINNIEINPKQILKLLKAIDVHKGCGPDKLPGIFLLNCADSLYSPIAMLFKRSLAEGLVPKVWKSAFITPVHKKGDKNQVDHYRPISKLCIIAKIFEKIVYDQVYASLRTWFIPEQHGFLQKRSTISNLVISNDYITSTMDKGDQVDVVFTDYSKAFDRIDHVILLKKLQSAGIHGNLFRWFTSYINNRSQAVTINGFTSGWQFVPSGVPQGSLLGPLLFIIFINDINSCFASSKFILFADDMKIYNKIHSDQDCVSLQRDLDSFSKYCEVNRLDLNVSKCFYITFSRKHSNIIFSYKLKNQSVSSVNYIRDLGLVQDSKLLYDRHIDNIIKKASRSLGFIIRSCAKFKNIKPIKILYCSLVRSILEYASEVWNPRYDYYINRIESIQRKFLRYIQFKTGIYDISYDLRCKRHHLLPLQLRRRIADLSYLHKIINGSIDSPELLECVKMKVPTRSSRTGFQLHVPKANTNYRQNSFFVRVSRQFNAMANEIDFFNCSLLSLKRNLASEYFGSQTND